MDSTYLRLSYIGTSELGRQIAAAIENGHIVIDSVHCSVVSVSDGTLSSVRHAILKTKLEGEEPDEPPTGPPWLNAFSEF